MCEANEDCPCQPEKVLVGWDEIIAHLLDRQAEKTISLLPSALRIYTKEHGFPTFAAPNGEVAALTTSICEWLKELERGEVPHGPLN
jgi:hypothetical protein